MRLKDLPPDTNVQAFKVKLPAKVLKAFKAFAGGEAEMYPVGPCMGYGFMMSPQAPTHKGERRLYPVPDSIPLPEMLNWRIVE